MKIIKTALFLSSAAFFLFACGPNPPANSGTNGNSTTGAPLADTLVTGRKLYNQNCAACHRVSGKGGKMDFDGKTIDPEDLTAEKIVKSPDEKLCEYIFEGAPDDGMPAFKEKLKEPQIREIVRFIRAELQKQ